MGLTSHDNFAVRLQRNGIDYGSVPNVRDYQAIVAEGHIQLTVRLIARQGKAGAKTNWGVKRVKGITGYNNFTVRLQRNGVGQGIAPKSVITRPSPPKVVLRYRSAGSAPGQSRRNQLRGHWPDRPRQFCRPVAAQRRWRTPRPRSR